MKFKALSVLFVASASFTPSMQAYAESHNYINIMRSSTQSHVFVQQSLDGEIASYEKSLRHGSASGAGQPTSQVWRGYGIGTTAGLELMKFLQFTVGHTFINMRYRDDSLESLIGSRVQTGMRAVFLSPIGNLEAGAGVQGSRLDYQKQLDNATLVGNGLYYSLGLNYFLSSRLSVYFEAKKAEDHLVRNNGSADIASINTDATIMGLGFRLWM